jgi:hypothetical protein
MNTTRFTELFREFNRKERYWLVREAVGSSSAKLGDDFRSKLQAALKKHSKPVEIPAHAEWAIDYHIDWIVALLRLYDRTKTGNSDTTFSNDTNEIRGSQQDFDLVVAFNDVLILIEAKGVGRWSNNQLESKIGRLTALTKCGLINENGQTNGGIQLYFVLCSPLQSKGITGSDTWPSWTKGFDGEPIWMCLTPPYGLTEFRAVTRYDNEKCWKVVSQAIRLDCNAGDAETATALTNTPEPS